MGRPHSGSPGASFHGGTHLALDFRRSDRLDLQSGGGGRSVERLLQGRHANSRPRTLRRRYLHSDPLCSDTAHQPHACLHNPVEGTIGSKKIVTGPAPVFHLDPQGPSGLRTKRPLFYYLENFRTTFPSKLPGGQISARYPPCTARVQPSCEKYFASPFAR